MTTEEQIARLEERLAWFQRHAVEQDKAMLELSDSVERLRNEVRALRESSSASSTLGGAVNEPADERPPHY